MLLGTASSASAQVSFFNDGPSSGQNLPFSESVRVNELLFISGQVGTDESGALVDGGIEPESRQVMDNIKQIIDRRGLTMNDVVKCTVFLADVSQWGSLIRSTPRIFRNLIPRDQHSVQMVSRLAPHSKSSALRLIQNVLNHGQ